MERKPEQISRDIAAFERKLTEAGTNEVLIDALKKKLTKLKNELKGGQMSARQLASNLLGARKKVKEMLAKDFKELILRLAKKPEYYFLKRYSKSEIKNDMSRPAKPVGYRFVGRGNYDVPSKRQIKKGLADGTVYSERRPKRSDVSRTAQLAKGGSIGKVIGYTQSNKPVYLNKSNEKSNNFTKQENIDAAAIFHKYLQGVTTPVMDRKIKEMRLFHEKEANVNKGTIVSEIVEQRAKDFNYSGEKYNSEIVFSKMAKGGSVKPTIKIKRRLEQIRKSIQNENVSYGELAELQSLSQYIDPNDIELRQAAGIPEFDEDEIAEGGSVTLRTYKIDLTFDNEYFQGGKERKKQFKKTFYAEAKNVTEANKKAIRYLKKDLPLAEKISIVKTELFKEGGSMYATRSGEIITLKNDVYGLGSMGLKKIKEGENVKFLEKLNNGETLIEYEGFKYMVDLENKMAKGGSVKPTIKIKRRLEQIRKSIQNENVSYGELAELQSLSQYIDPNDIELKQAAGIPEFDEDEMEKGGSVEKETFNLHFQYNPGNLKNSEAEKIVEKYTKNWKHDNDFDSVSFYVFSLSKEKADELKKELKMEDTYNIEIEKSKYAKGGEIKPTIKIKRRLEQIRKSIQNENVSYGELAELQSLSQYIDPNDIELKQAAGIPEFDEDEMAKGGNVPSVFVIGSDVARDRYDYDEEQLIDEFSEFVGDFHNGKTYEEGIDFSFITARGDDFPNAISITNPDFLKIIMRNKEAIKFLKGLKGNNKYEKGGSVKPTIKIKRRLEQIRKSIQNENVSYGELAELQSLSQYIDPNDIELKQAAGISEFDEDEMAKGGSVDDEDVEEIFLTGNEDWDEISSLFGIEDEEFSQKKLENAKELLKISDDFGWDYLVLLKNRKIAFPDRNSGITYVTEKPIKNVDEFVTKFKNCFDDSKMAKGGSVKKGKYTYIPQEDIDYLVTEYGRKIDGNKLLDGAYAKGNTKAPKIVRTQFEEDDYEYGKGGEISVYNLRKGDKVRTRKGDIETIIKKTGSGSYETIENDYTHSPESLEFVSRPGRKMAKGGGVGKYYVMDAKSGEVVSKGFDTEEEAKVEKFRMFEETGNFFLTQKMMAKGGSVDETMNFKIIPMKSMNIKGSPDLIEPYYSLAYTVKGSFSDANKSAQEFVKNNEDIISASVIKIHPSGQPLKHKKVSYVTKDEIQKYDIGGFVDETMTRSKIREAIAESSKMKVADVVAYFKSRYPKADMKIVREEAKEMIDEAKRFN